MAFDANDLHPARVSSTRRLTAVPPTDRPSLEQLTTDN